MNTKLERLGQFARKMWLELDCEARFAYYYGTGTCGFLEDIVAMHHEKLTDKEYEELFDYFDNDVYSNFYRKLRDIRFTLGGIEYMEHDVISKALFDLLSFVLTGEASTGYNDNQIQIRIIGDTVMMLDGCDNKTLLTVKLEVQ